MKTWIYLLMTLALTSCVTLRPTETGTFTDTAVWINFRESGFLSIGKNREGFIER